MNVTMLRILNNLEENYPHALEQQFPQVFARIIELWDKPEMDDYFNGLLMSNRPSRQGFPKKVASEILFLNMTHARQREHAGAAEPWNSIPVAGKVQFEPQRTALSAVSLIKAAESGDCNAVRSCIAAGLNVDVCDERKWTPLMISAFNGNEALALSLVRSGANLHHRDNAGYAPLHWAAFNGHVAVVKLLIDHGADVNARSQHGWTALLQAVTRGHKNVVSLLLERGADVNAASDDGWTALHKAAANGRLPEVILLLGNGADPHAKYKDGTLPVDLARKNQHEQIVAVLTEKISQRA